MSGCWLWTGSADNGYGQIHWKRKTGKAHRIAYEILIGPVPDGLEIDHLCRVRSCCNPAHMEPVTHRENITRGAGATIIRLGRCRSGRHLIRSDTDIQVMKGGSNPGARTCRACYLEAQRRYDGRRRSSI